MVKVSSHMMMNSPIAKPKMDPSPNYSRKRYPQTKKCLKSSLAFEKRPNKAAYSDSTMKTTKIGKLRNHENLVDRNTSYDVLSTDTLSNMALKRNIFVFCAHMVAYFAGSKIPYYRELISFAHSRRIP